MGKIIAISNRKGGVGKTTTAINLGAALARKGKRVLLVDIDPQASLSKALGIREANLSMYEVMLGSCKAQDAVIKLEGYDVLPAVDDMIGLEGELAKVVDRIPAMILKQALHTIKRSYDFIFIDCPPSFEILTLNAMTAADDLFVPLIAEPMSLEGVSALLDTIDRVRESLNKDLRFAGVIMTKYNNRRKINREVVETIKRHFPAAIFPTPIRDNVSLAESPSHGKDIFQYDSKSAGAQDYLAIADEIILREG